MNMMHAINWRRWGGIAGLIGPSLFVAIFLIEGWLRPGYNPTQMFVSELALGARGWIQITNFLVYGVLLLLFARGLATEFASGPGLRGGPLLLALNGLRTIGVGLFVTDPAAASLAALSGHALLHLLLALSAFVLWPLTCVVFYRRLRVEPAWRPLAGWTLCAAAVIAGASLLLIAGAMLPAALPTLLSARMGLIQRSSIITFAVWQFAVAWQLLRRSYRAARAGA